MRALQDDTLTTVAAFASNTPDGQPRALVADPDGLFGVTVGGPDAGAVFRLSPAGTFAVLYRFACGADGGSPQLLLRTDDGALYGTTRTGPNQFGTVFRVDRQSDGIQTLFTFQRPEDGKNPYFLMDGRDGFLYGLTQSGGLSDRGTLFRLAPGGEFTVLRHFALSDGYVPSLTLAADKQIYAVETLASCSLGSFRCFGRFDRVSRHGDLVALTSQRGLDVPLPLVAGGDGRLYGTLYGGATLVATTDGGLTFLGQSFTPS